MGGIHKKIHRERDKLLQRSSEHVTISSRDGLTLHGDLFLAEPAAAKRTAILFRGYTSCGMNDCATMAEYFMEKGFNALVVDRRSHGQNEGEYIGFGILDRYDCIEWISYITGRLGEKHEVVLFGVSIVDGEITVKSPSVMQGYYKDEASTAEALKDGWLYTGDLGYVDDQKRLFITGRKKNLIILSNVENVSPEELENKAEAARIAQELMVYSEDEALTLELFPGNELYKDMSEEEMLNAIREKVKQLNKTLPSSKAVRRIRVRKAEFEKTTSRKIKRSQTDKGEVI